MESNINAITCRGLIIHEGKLLVVKLRPADNFYCLPGGKIERFEKIEECMVREIEEELGVKPEVGNLLFIHELIREEHNEHRIEFLYHITNGKDFLDIHNLQATHSFELVDKVRSDIHDNNTLNIKPSFVMKELRNIDRNNMQNYKIKVIMTSATD